VLCSEDINRKHINKSEVKEKEGYDIDLSRYVLILPKGYSGHKFLEYLRSQKIQAEMSFSRGIVLIMSPFNSEKDFKNVYEAVLKLEMKRICSPIESKYFSDIPIKKLEPYEVFQKRSKWCEIEKSEGCIAKEAIIPYPPGIPLLCPGEVISKNSINIIKDYVNNKKSILGVENDKVQVVINSEGWYQRRNCVKIYLFRIENIGGMRSKLWNLILLLSKRIKLR
jgi:arginine/lysine/ornithine decarboxylase